MSVLSLDQRAKVAACLVDGTSIRATERITGVHRDTVMRLGVTLGEGCAKLHDRLVREVPCRLLQCDEAWTFCHTKAVRVRPEDPAEWGDQYVYVALDVPSRAIVAYLVGKRDGAHAGRFAMDLRARTTGRPQISSDGWGPYPEAIWRAYGYEVDFGQVVKDYRTGARRWPDHRYEPPREPFITRTAVAGSPSAADISTSLVERQNLQLRSCIKRMARLTNAYSKKKRNLDAAVALHVLWYNYGTVHGTIRSTPAMALGLTRHVWTLEEMIAEAMAAEAEPAPTPVEPPPRVAPLPEQPWQKPEQLGLFDRPAVAKAPVSTRIALRLIRGGLS
jgi:IS1 family transposase